MLILDSAMRKFDPVSLPSGARDSCVRHGHRTRVEASPCMAVHAQLEAHHADPAHALKTPPVSRTSARSGRRKGQMACTIFNKNNLVRHIPNQCQPGAIDIARCHMCRFAQRCRIAEDPAASHSIGAEQQWHLSVAFFREMASTLERAPMADSCICRPATAHRTTCCAAPTKAAVFAWPFSLRA
jgi:plasmid maintenance system killer protein